MYVDLNTGTCEDCPANTFQIQDVSAILCTDCSADTYTVGDIRVGLTESDVCKG